MSTGNKTHGEVVVVLVCLFLLIVKSRSHKTRQSSRRWWDGSQAWVALPPWAMLSGTRTATPIVTRAPPVAVEAAGTFTARTFSARILQLCKETDFLILSGYSWSVGSLPPPCTHMRVHTHTHPHTHPCPNPSAVPTSLQQPLLSSAPIWIAQSIKGNWWIKAKCPAAIIFPSHPRQNFSYMNEPGKKGKKKGFDNSPQR